MSKPPDWGRVQYGANRSPRARADRGRGDQSSGCRGGRSGGGREDGGDFWQADQPVALVARAVHEAVPVPRAGRVRGGRAPSGDPDESSDRDEDGQETQAGRRDETATIAGPLVRGPRHEPVPRRRPRRGCTKQGCTAQRRATGLGATRGCGVNVCGRGPISSAWARRAMRASARPTRWRPPMGRAGESRSGQPPRPRRWPWRVRGRVPKRTSRPTACRRPHANAPGFGARSALEGRDVRIGAVVVRLDRFGRVRHVQPIPPRALHHTRVGALGQAGDADRSRHHRRRTHGRQPATRRRATPPR